MEVSNDRRYIRNKVIVTGTVASLVEIHTTIRRKTLVANFEFAVETPPHDNQPDDAIKPFCMLVTVFGRKAGKCHANLVLGQRIGLVGKLNWRAERGEIEITARNIFCLETNQPCCIEGLTDLGAVDRC